MDGSKVPKTIAELRVDIKNAMTPLSDLQKQFDTLDKQIEKTQAGMAGLGKPAATGAKGMTAAAVATKNFNKEIEKQSVLASQWERKISWFISGTAFYGGIRAIQGMSKALTQLESDMTVIARTTDDATFNFNKMRDELIEVGKDFGRGWESVSQVATEWTKAGYNVADTLELVRTSLLALNVADMTVQQATSGLIAIMSQWDLQAQDLELVIDKLNITSDRYAITTGDLVEGILRSSGAARAANIEFDELVGMITATRVASGRAGAEIGNAMNTILSYITRQSTLNKLAQAGIATFADEARTKLRPAVDIMADIVEKWQDNAEAMPEALVEMADSMGMFSEEMAEMVDLQGEWTDLQKIEVEQATAGVRRRQFLIALMRNFAMVQDVVNNLSEAEGYSMVQNIQTMKTLERQYEQLKLEILGLAQALGDAGLMSQLKAVVSVGKDVISFFSNLDSGLQTFLLTLGEIIIVVGIYKSMMAMMGGGVAIAGLQGLTSGVSGLSAALSTLVSTGALVTPIITLLGTLLATQWLNARRLAEEYEQYSEVLLKVADRQDQLNKITDTSIKGSIAHTTAMDELRELNHAIIEQYPHLLESYDKENNLLLLNAEAIQKVKDEQEELNDVTHDYIGHVERMMDYYDEQIKYMEKEADKYDDTAKKVKDLSRQRESLVKSIKDETLASEEHERYVKQEEDARRIIIDLVGEEAAKRIEAANWHIDAINKEIEGIQALAETTREAARERIRESQAQTRRVLEDTKRRIEAALAEEAAFGKYREAPAWVSKAPPWLQTVEEWWRKSTDIQILKDFALTALGYDVPTLTERAEREQKEYVLGLQKTVGDLEEQLRKYDDQLVETLPSIDKLGKFFGDTGEKAKASSSAAKELMNVISKYIETAMRAADVQAMLNNETQRTIDGYKAKIDYHSRDTATAQERAIALQTEAEMVGKLKEKQEGVHQEANFLREALAKLEARQKTLNITTDEGWDAYKKLESQIESIKATIEKLGIEWFGLAKAQEETIVQTKILQDELRQIDFYARLGVTTVQEQLRQVRYAYGEMQGARALTVAEEMDLIQRQHSAYKQMLNDMKKDAEEAYRERIRLLEKETERAIALIQKQIDALDKEDTQDQREEERRQHEKRMQELLEKRRYHELRTGREHSQAILDIDKQMEEERIKWEQRQADWTREDKRRSLQQQIQDIRDRAKEQQEAWQRAYERMQEDFSDHNISMIALAAVHDPAYFEDAKNKAQQWIDGFKATLPPTFVANYLKSIVPASVSGIAGGGGGGGDGSSSGGFAYYDKYGYPHVVKDLDTALKYTAGDIDYYTGSYSGGYARDDDGNRIDPFTGGAFPKSHAGSRVVGEGLAELIPGELVFPPDLSIQLQRLISVLSVRPISASQTQQQWRDGGNVEIRGNLLNIENANFEDDTDIEIMSRELRRQVEGLRRR